MTSYANHICAYADTIRPINLKVWQVLTRFAHFMVVALAALTAVVATAESASTPAGPDGPAQIAFTPAKSPGPVVILLSGQ